MTDHILLTDGWLHLWNGDLARADALIAEDFDSHAAVLLPGAGALSGRAALVAWIGGLHQMFSGLTFTIEVGPIANADHLVVRWRSRGTYNGGFPGAAEAAVGREVGFTGIDILRIADGRLVEYWVESDMLSLLQQLGVMG